MELIDLNETIFKCGERYFRVVNVEDNDVPILRTLFPALNVRLCVPTIREVDASGGEKEHGVVDPRPDEFAPADGGRKVDLKNLGGMR